MPKKKTKAAKSTKRVASQKAPAKKRQTSPTKKTSSPNRKKAAPASGAEKVNTAAAEKKSVKASASRSANRATNSATNKKSAAKVESKKAESKTTVQKTAQKPIQKRTKTSALEILDHEALASLGVQVNRVLNANPELAPMLFVNPVLAMEEAGVKVSRPMVHHILSRLRHPPALRERREVLEASLRESLGGTPQPNNSAWLAKTLFEKLKLQPVETHDVSPTYKPLRDAATEKRLQALRPKRTQRYTNLPRHHGPSRLQVKEQPGSVRRMDLEATLPALKPAKQTPKRVTLEMLYFYKDVNPVARDLLELAIIQRRGLRLNSRYSYRLIKEGKRANVFHRWFRQVRFPEGKA